MAPGPSADSVRSTQTAFVEERKMLFGYDVSEFQGAIDYDALRADFLIVRDVYATTHVDTQFAQNWAECRRRGIPRWAYSFAEPGWTSASDSVAFTLAAHDDYQTGEGQVIDVERDVPGVVQWTFDWCRRFEEARGFKPLVYLNRSILAGHDWSPVFGNDNGLWLAVGDDAPEQFGFDLHGWPVLAAKQYILDGRPAAGFPNATGLDYDTFNGAPDTFLAYGRRDGAAPRVRSEAPPPAGFPYTIVGGDTLSGIAARCGIGWRDLWNFAGNHDVVPNPDLIFPGQVIRTPCNQQD